MEDPSPHTLSEHREKPPGQLLRLQNLPGAARVSAFNPLTDLTQEFPERFGLPWQQQEVFTCFSNGASEEDLQKIDSAIPANRIIRTLTLQMEVFFSLHSSQTQPFQSLPGFLPPLPDSPSHQLSPTFPSPLKKNIHPS